MTGHMIRQIQANQIWESLPTVPTVEAPPLLDQILPQGSCSPRQKVERMVRALEIVQQVQERVAQLLEREYAKMRQIAEASEVPQSPRMLPIYELTQQAMQEHWNALEAVEDMRLDDALECERRSEECLGQSETVMRQLQGMVARSS